jgi:hypothetical protein
MADHSFFFAESVRLVLECKSRWNSEEFADVLTKCKSIRNIVVTNAQSLRNELDMIYQEIYCIKENIYHHGALIFSPRIATAAIFISGGDSVTPEIIDDELIREVDYKWPDIMLFLGLGRLVIKNYESSGEGGGIGWLDFVDLGEDALFVFTTVFLGLLNERSSQVEEAFYMTNYGFFPSQLPRPFARIEFPLCFSPPQRTPIWGSPDDLS